MIEVIDIHRNYGSLEVLKGVDLTIKKGELLSIVGASGAGKSTLLHIIGGLDKQDRGLVKINGIDFNQLGKSKLAEFRNKQIGFIFQFHHLLPEFSAFENVCIPGFLSKTAQARVKERAELLLAEVGLSNRMKHKPTEMSGGEQQRVAVARALINYPSVVLADEPTGNLDSRNAQMMHDLFLELQEKYKLTFVIATHNENLSKQANRVVRMKDGMIEP